MDIGNYPIYSNTDKAQKSRSFDGVPEPKNSWDQIGDYDQGPATGNNANVDDDDEEDDKKPAQPEPPKKTATQKEKQESDDAASLASQAAVKESNKNQS